MQRRSFLASILAAGAAPAIARAGILMPIKPRIITLNTLTEDYVRELAASMNRTREIIHVGIVGGFGLARVKAEGQALTYDDLTFNPLGMRSVLRPGELLPPGWEYATSNVGQEYP